ncbi:FAA hydrolase family protein [Streptomyces sp. SID5914]|nr:fumarylacetoacetate hydrolase family protein [Streptomyces sp. SID5914]MZG16362.1 FAA hydrolase family protein [Streptomyces sp. SID5914]
MRLYSTDQGIGREDQPGRLSLLDLPYDDIDALLRGPGVTAAGTAPVRRVLNVDEVTLAAPVRRPGKVLIVGLNYPSHADETTEMLASLGRTDIELPKEPNFVIAAGSAVIAHRQPVRLPPVAAERVDYEGEVCVIIGSDAADVAPETAWQHVAGLTIGNDISARDIQFRAMMGDAAASIGVAKSFDTFKPLGPCLVTTDEFAHPLDLRLQTQVNGELRQDDRTGTLIHPIGDLISYLSRYQTLEAGDVICTGTPRGAGVFSGRFLQPGDTVEITVEGLGTLVNQVTL